MNNRPGRLRLTARAMLFFDRVTVDTRFVQSEMIVIRNMFHDIFHTAAEDIAELIDGIDFYILIMAKSVELRPVDVMVGVEVILGNTAAFHGLPQTVVANHISSHSCRYIYTIISYQHKSRKEKERKMPEKIKNFLRFFLKIRLTNGENSGIIIGRV